MAEIPEGIGLVVFVGAVIVALSAAAPLLDIYALYQQGATQPGDGVPVGVIRSMAKVLFWTVIPASVASIVWLAS